MMTVWKGLTVSDYLSYKRDLPAPEYPGFNTDAKASEIAPQRLHISSKAHTIYCHHDSPFHSSISYLLRGIALHA